MCSNASLKTTRLVGNASVKGLVLTSQRVLSAKLYLLWRVFIIHLLSFYACVVLRPVAQLYGQIRSDWNQCFVIDSSWSHRLGTNRSHVHTAFYVTRDSIFTPFVECVFLLTFLCMYLRSRGTFLAHFSWVVPWASCRLPDPLTVFCDMFAAVSS